MARSKQKPPPRRERDGGKLCGVDDLADGSICSTNIIAELAAQRGRLIDRFGRERSEAILKNWSPQAIMVMGIRRVPEGGER